MIIIIRYFNSLNAVDCWCIQKFRRIQIVNFVNFVVFINFISTHFSILFNLGLLIMNLSPQNNANLKIMIT